MKYFFLLIISVFLVYACNNGGKTNGTDQPGNTNQNTLKSISCSILNTFPHDTSSFTQGITFYKGELYEGTGEHGHSKLMKVDLQTGKPVNQISLDGKYFGEGIAVVNDTIFQLTWQEHVVLVYDLKTFKKIKEFPLTTDGWGITYDGKSLIVSDGSSNLYFYEPSTFRLLHTQSIKQNQELAFNINELEYIDGYVYANQWQLPYILKIDPSDGQVIARADVSDLWKRILAEDPDADVPNGIAYDEASKKIYITGKRWPKLFEVQFSN